MDHWWNTMELQPVWRRELAGGSRDRMLTWASVLSPDPLNGVAVLVQVAEEDGDLS